jgi:UDP-N-acetylglucosamine 3-dehydrogenase
MVGHIERFNPAVQALKKHIAAGDLGRVLQLDARRQGPYPTRISDVGVVIDLAVHDIDIMRFVSGQEVERVFAETQFQIHADKEDLVSAIMRFSGGAMGTLNINWLTPTKIRELTVLGSNGLFVVNYLTQDLMFFKNSAVTADWDTLHILRGVTEGEMIKFVFPRKEPLRAEQEAFLTSIIDDTPVPISAEDGLRALKLAQMMITAGQDNQVIHLGDVIFA